MLKTVKVPMLKMNHFPPDSESTQICSTCQKSWERTPSQIKNCRKECQTCRYNRYGKKHYLKMKRKKKYMEKKPFEKQTAVASHIESAQDKVRNIVIAIQELAVLGLIHPYTSNQGTKIFSRLVQELAEAEKIFSREKMPSCDFTLS